MTIFSYFRNHEIRVLCPAVYILANSNRSVLYTGVTNDLYRRVWEHKQKTIPGSFTSRYNVDRLVFYETGEQIESMLEREKQIKKGSRTKKLELIETMNPAWKDLFEDLSPSF